MNKEYVDIHTIGITPFEIPNYKEKCINTNNPITPFNIEYLNQLYKGNINQWYMYLYLCNISNIKSVSFDDRRRYQKREADKTFRNNNRERLRLISAENYKKNKHLILEKSKIYYKNNKNDILETHKIYRENNKDVIRYKKKKYYNDNKEMCLHKKKQSILNNLKTNLNYLFNILGNDFKICPFCGKTINTENILSKSIAIHHLNKNLKTMNPFDYMKNKHTYEEIENFNESEGGFAIMHFGCHISHHNING